MNRFTWLVRREMWEHRGIWIAPAAVLLLLSFLAVTGYLFIGDVVIDDDTPVAETGKPLTDEQIDRIQKAIEKREQTIEEGELRGWTAEEREESLAKLEALKKVDASKRRVSPATALKILPKSKQLKIVGLFYAAVAALMFIVSGGIAFFYSLDALYSDRRDRSVLFWKSLPLSDAETVLAKFFTATVVIAVVAVIAALAGQLIAAGGAAAKVAMIDGDPSIFWKPAVLGTALSWSVLLTFVSVFWYAPLVAYLLVVSAWASRGPFLWATLPPMAVVMLEKIALGTRHVGDFLIHRFMGPMKAMVNDTSNMPGVVVRETDGNLSAMTSVAEIAGRVLDFAMSPAMLIGLVGAAALVAVAIWGRRYRDENT